MLSDFDHRDHDHFDHFFKAFFCKHACFSHFISTFALEKPDCATYTNTIISNAFSSILLFPSTFCGWGTLCDQTGDLLCDGLALQVFLNLK